MKKLTLKLDSLRIESFELSPTQRRGSGTVQAREYSDFDCLGATGNKIDPLTRTYDQSCDVCPLPTNASTCPFTCRATCGATCGSTCGC